MNFTSNRDARPENGQGQVALSLDVARVRLADIGRSTIYELAGGGAFTIRKINGKSCILQTELDAYIASLPVAEIKDVKKSGVAK